MIIRVKTEIGNVYIRKGPGKEYEPVGRVIRNREYNATEKTENNWYFITNGENAYTGETVQGYACGDYIFPVEEETKEPVITFTKEELKEIYDYIGGLIIV